MNTHKKINDPSKPDREIFNNIFPKVFPLAKLVLYLIYSTAILYAQTSSPKFEYVPFNKGLSQKTVLCILQDSKGFMWFGTLNGLYKYDGYNFTAYKNEPDNPYSLSDDNITSLYEDKAGNL